MFQKGYRVGTRSLRICYPEAKSYREAVKKAKAEFPEWKSKGYYLYRVVNEDEEQAMATMEMPGGGHAV
jgi:hypothetical protein